MTKVLIAECSPITPEIVKLMILKDLDNQKDGRFYNEEDFGNIEEFFYEDLERAGLITIEMIGDRYKIKITHHGKLCIN